MNWENDIKELEQFFGDTELPKGQFRLNNWSVITNVPGFIESHFACVKSNMNVKTFLPYLDRLKELRELLVNQT